MGFSSAIEGEVLWLVASEDKIAVKDKLQGLGVIQDNANVCPI